MKTLIIDGNNSAWRLGKRLPILTARGKQVQVIYGFMRMLHSALVKFEPDAILVCWDNGRSAYRKKLYPAYKANRNHEGTKEERKEYKSIMSQIARLQKILKLLGVASVDFPETEGDDLLGIASQCLGGDRILISTDKDVLPLVNGNVSVWSPGKETLYSERNFKKLIGMTPFQFLEMRAITGEKGDNIEGAAKGLGEKTAKELIHKYGSLRKIFKHTRRIKKMGSRHALLCKEGVCGRVYRNLLLMDLTLPISRPDGPEIKKLIRKKIARKRRLDKLAVLSYFKRKKFQSLLRDFPTWILPFKELGS